MSTTSRLYVSANSANSKTTTRQRTMRHRSAKRLYAISLAAAAVPAVMSAQHALADIHSASTDPFNTGDWASPNGSSIIIIDGNTLSLTQPSNPAVGVGGSMVFNT